MTPSEQRALHIWQSNRHLPPAERMELIECEICLGWGMLPVVGSDGFPVGPDAECNYCGGTGKVEVSKQ
jgi:hypothetical protein